MNRKYRGVIIAANWKMNLLPSEVRVYADGLKTLIPRGKLCETVICPPHVMIPAAIKAFKNSRISVGAQNLNENSSGAYTGEVSAAQLRDLGVGYVIIGHSERRGYYGETDDTVNKKLLAALENGLRPIVCVGESLGQRGAGVTADIVSLQVKLAFSGVPAGKARRVIVAYEPIWAIGTGKTATAEDAQDICRAIRATIRSLYGSRISRSVSVLYGGSMNGDNAAALLKQPDIDGGLIGSASLYPASMASIVAAVYTSGAQGGLI